MALSLAISGLSAGYAHRPVVENLSLEPIGPGIAALVGPNGAGKSTLLRAIAGLLPATGSVKVDGHELVIALDLRGYAVSSGSACASGLREASPAIRALHADAPWRASSALRVSIGPETTREAARSFVEALTAAVGYLREAPAVSRGLAAP